MNFYLPDLLKNIEKESPNRMGKFMFSDFHYSQMLEAMDSAFGINSFTYPKLKKETPMIGEYFCFKYKGNTDYSFCITNAYLEQEPSSFIDFEPWLYDVVAYPISSRFKSESTKYWVANDPEYAILLKFQEWIGSIQMAITVDKKLKYFEEKSSGVINLNEDKPFQKWEIDLLEDHFAKSISDAKNKIKSQPQELQAKLLIEIESVNKTLAKLVDDAKEEGITKITWWKKKYFKKIVEEIVLKISIEGMFSFAKFITKNILIPINLIFTTPSTNTDEIKFILEPKFHNEIRHLEKYIDILQTEVYLSETNSDIV